MIKVTKETTQLEGTKVQLMSEFCCLVNHLVTKHDEDEPILTREELDRCIELATLSKDELHQQVDELHQQVIEAISDMLCKFL